MQQKMIQIIPTFNWIYSLIAAVFSVVIGWSLSSSALVNEIADTFRFYLYRSWWLFSCPLWPLPCKSLTPSKSLDELVELKFLGISNTGVTGQHLRSAKKIKTSNLLFFICIVAYILLSAENLMLQNTESVIVLRNPWWLPSCIKQSRNEAFRKNKV